MNLLSDMSNEEFCLFNPAYCGYLLYSVINEYQLKSDKELPCCMIYLFLPLIMTKHISISFPRSFTTSFMSWANDNQVYTLNFNERIADYFEVTQTAIDFLIDFNAISISENGSISIAIPDIPNNPSLFKKSETMKSHLASAKLLGKWFANYQPATIYSILGVKP